VEKILPWKKGRIHRWKKKNAVLSTPQNERKESPRMEGKEGSSVLEGEDSGVKLSVGPNQSSFWGNKAGSKRIPAEENYIQRACRRPYRCSIPF